MDQTPVHEHHNPDLLKLIPPSSRRVVEVGCSSGALAREFKKISAGCHYVGVEIDEQYASLARRYCDQTLCLDIEQAGDDFFAAQRDCDCWVFGDALEHLRDPWRLLRAIRAVLPGNGCVVACIPNAQHWSLVSRLAIGDFRYEDQGLLDKTHLRWFTRQTMVELFEDAGFIIAEGIPRIFHEPGRDAVLPLIGQLARACGADPNSAINDAVPLQFVVRAVPA